MQARRAPGRSRAPDTVLVIHSSDELYGADRILLEVVTALRDLAGLRVLVWLPVGVGDGALSAELAARGFEVQALALPILRRADLSARGLVTLVRVGWATLRRLRAERVPAIYLMTSACLPVAPLARLAGTRFVLVHLQELWSGAERWVLRALALCCTAAIAISAPVARASRLRRHPPVIVVENGVSLPAIDPAVAPRPGQVPDPTAPTIDSDRVGAVPAGGPRYLVASRWNAWKGHRTLLRAWELAGCPGTLTVLGAPPPVGIGVDVPRLVDELVSRPDTVEVVGQVESIGDHLAAADALILPSDHPEPFGLVVIEAFGRDRPAIASRAGGPLDVITDGVDGWFFDLGSADSLADLLRRLDRDTLRAAGLRAGRTYRERYTPEAYRQRIAAAVTGVWRS